MDATIGVNNNEKVVLWCGGGQSGVAVVRFSEFAELKEVQTAFYTLSIDSAAVCIELHCMSGSLSVTVHLGPYGVA